MDPKGLGLRGRNRCRNRQPADRDARGLGGVTSDEALHKDLEIRLIAFTVFVHFVVDFHTFFGDAAYPTDVMGAAI